MRQTSEAHRLLGPRLLTGLAEEISADEARKLALWAQGLIGAPPPGGVPALLRRLGTVQLDTIAVLARTHELVPFSRLGAVGLPKVHDAYWGRPPRAFEYWGHLASVLPIEMWPWMAAKRRRWHERHRHKRLGWASQIEFVRAQLKDRGALTITELGGGREVHTPRAGDLARAGAGQWWDWSPMKEAIEELFLTGEVACVERRGWRRVYELAEQVIAPGLLAQEPSDAECHGRLVAMAAERLGVATLADLANYWWMRPSDATAGLLSAGLVPVNVEGWSKSAWAHPAALAALSSGIRGRHRTTLLSPFDSLIWFRERAERIFGLRLRLEAYVPAAKRVHGYFVMPVLAGGRLVGRVDPKRDGKSLVLRQLSAEPGEASSVATALMEAAGWVGCDSVVLERVEPAGLMPALRAELSRLGAA